MTTFVFSSVVFEACSEYIKQLDILSFPFSKPKFKQVILLHLNTFPLSELGMRNFYPRTVKGPFHVARQSARLSRQCAKISFT